MITHVTEREMQLEKELHELQKKDRHIRRMLCVAVADRPYMDDGEASDQEIDYLRDDPEVIENKLYQRNIKRWNQINKDQKEN